MLRVPGFVRIIPMPVTRLIRSFIAFLLKTPILVALGLVAAYFLFAWFGFGPLVKWAAPKYLADKSGHQLSIAQAEFDPLALSLRLGGVRLAEPDGKPLLALDGLYVDLEAASLPRLAWTLAAVEVTAPRVHLVRRADGRLNWTRLIEAFRKEEEEPPKPMPRLHIRRMALEDGRIEFSDQAVSPAYDTVIAPLSLQVTDLSSLPDTEGRYRLTARSSQGLALRGEGSLHLEPLRVAGEIALDNLVLVQLAPYLRPHVLIAPPRGTLALSGRFRVAKAPDRIAVSLDRLGLDLTGLALRGEADGEDTLALGRLSLAGGRFELGSRQLAFDRLALADGSLDLQVATDGRLQVQDWFAPPAQAAPPPASPPGPPWQVELGAIEVSRLGLRYRDAVTSIQARAGELGLKLRARAEIGGAATRAEIADLALDLNDVQVTARLTPWIALDSLALRGERIGLDSAGGPPWRAALQGVSLQAGGVRYTETALAQPVVVRLGSIAIGFEARAEAGAGAPDLAVQDLGLNASGIDLASADHGSLLSLAGFALEAGDLSLSGRRFEAERLVLSRGRLLAERDAQGRFPLLQALQPAATASGQGRGAGPRAGAAPDWRFALGRAELQDFQVGLRDATVDPPLELTLQSIQVRADRLSQDLKRAIPLKLSLTVREGGALQAEGRVIPAAPRADLRLRLSELSLTPAQPLVGQAANLALVSGRASGQGRLHYDRDIRYEGTFRIDDLLVNEAGSENRFLAWKSLATDDLQAGNRGVEIGELRLDRPGAKLIIYEDKSVNLKRILKKTSAPQAMASSTEASAPPPQPVARGVGPEADAFPVTINRVRVDQGELDFADLSLALPFAARIHEFKGGVNGIASTPGTPAQLELDGRVDEYGLARAAGQIELFDPTRYMDIKVVFRNVEMTRLTPYTATFAGRKIASGKLSLDLEYKIKERQLLGENQIVMDKLTLGERVESPTARNLPLDLAIAILKDSKGVIDLGLPVSGSLDDPQFSYGQIIWKAIVNVITKVVTAPFRALGRLFGGSGEEMEAVVFDAGEARLTPPEKEKLVKLARGLAERPNLALSVRGAYQPEADAAAIREARLRRAIALQMGLKLEPDEDPGPMATAQPAVRDALEALYAQRLGDAALKDLKARHRLANPGAEPEGTVGRLISRVSGLLQAKPQPLSAEEAAALKGADLYELMYQRLLATETVDTVQLQALGRQRGEAIAAALTAAGLPPERIQTGPPEASEGEPGPVRVKLWVAVAAAPSAATAQP